MNDIQMTAMQPAGSTSTGKKSWFEAMADAWGQALDTQAQRIVDKSETVGNSQGSGTEGAGDSASDITELTAMSLRMSFLASSSHTSISSVGSALETMARKQ